MSRRVLTTLVAAAALLAAVPAVVGQTWSAFTGQTSNPAGSYAAQRIFSGTRTTSAWNVRDFATGTEVDRSDTLSYAGDTRTGATNALPTAYSATKYLELRLEQSLPRGLAISGATFRLDLARTGAAGTLKFFVEVRQASTNTVIATHGSSAAPLQTTTATTQQPFTVSLPEIATTTAANDLAIRVYAWDTAGASIALDRAQVDGSTAYGGFTLFETSAVEAFGAAPVTYPYALSATDATLVTTSGWTTAFAATHYLKLTFEPDLPAGATVTAATLDHSFRPVAGGPSPQQCVYYEVRSGATVLGSSFSGITAAAPSCTTSTTTFKTDTLDLSSAITSAATANDVEIRVYGRSAQSKGSDHDRALLALTWRLDP